MIAKARGLVRPELIDALEVMAERLRATCERQLPAEWPEMPTADEIVGRADPARSAGSASTCPGAGPRIHRP